MLFSKITQYLCYFALMSMISNHWNGWVSYYTVILCTLQGDPASETDIQAIVKRLQSEGGVHHVASAIGGWEQVRCVAARINRSFIFVILLSNIFRTLKYIITCWIDVTVVLQTGTLTKSSLEDFDRNINLRAKTHFILAKYLLPELAKTDGEIKKLEQAMWLLMSHNLCTIW